MQEEYTNEPVVQEQNEPEQPAAPTPESDVDPQQMVTVVDIHFRNNSKTYYFDPAGIDVADGSHVIIDTSRGDEFGYCVGASHEVRVSEIVPPLRKVLRIATEQDEKINAENQEKEKRAFEICQQKIADHQLDMQLVSSECAFDGSKILFFFTADGRVDFRELVKDLASVFRTRIELRQIGVRDKAKMVGGLGVCGRPFCCKEFLDDFQPVSIKMAKTQNLSLNPSKISGTCGRLMCCLKYEQEAYEDLLKTAPKNESFVDTPDGRGTVTEVNLLRQSVKVRMEDHPETIGCYKNCDICVLRSGKAHKNDPPIPKDLAPISSKPRPVMVEQTFESMPELVYADEVAQISTPQEEPQTDAEPLEEESKPEKKHTRRRRRSHGGNKGVSENADTAKPAGQGPKQAKPVEKQARPVKNPAGEQKTAEKKPHEKQQNAKKPADGAASQPHRQKNNSRRRHRPRKSPGGQGNAPKSE